ncbi:MAG: hypothetical protein Ta2D_13000 [Rickettsiales bacterium]|nr:MAG: hypothetical protein Ta2D_13000 [Rickettsiales bacterium]
MIDYKGEYKKQIKENLLQVLNDLESKNIKLGRKIWIFL